MSRRVPASVRNTGNFSSSRVLVSCPRQFDLTQSEVGFENDGFRQPTTLIILTFFILSLSGPFVNNSALSIVGPINRITQVDRHRILEAIDRDSAAVIIIDERYRAITADSEQVSYGIERSRMYGARERPASVRVDVQRIG
jgi:hypothetical protein